MRTLGTDNTYYGFVFIYDKGDSLLANQNGQHCSQIVWEYSKDHQNGDKIRFYYPNDWLITLGRSKPFLEDFCKVVSNMFSKTKYIGKFNASEINKSLSVKKINESFSYNYIDNGKGKDIITPESYIGNKGDLIINDIWRGFEIDISDVKGKRAMLAYSSFCILRYLFCSHYHNTVDNFIYLRKLRNTVNTKATDFELLQMAHYDNLHMPSGSYGFFDRYCITNKDTCAYKLKSLEDFKKAFDVSYSLNKAFVGPLTKITIREIQEHFEKKELSKIYEKLK